MSGNCLRSRWFVAGLWLCAGIITVVHGVLQYVGAAGGSISPGLPASRRCSNPQKHMVNGHVGNAGSFHSAAPNTRSPIAANSLSSALDFNPQVAHKHEPDALRNVMMGAAGALGVVSGFLGIQKLPSLVAIAAFAILAGWLAKSNLKLKSSVEIRTPRQFSEEWSPATNGVCISIAACIATWAYNTQNFTVGSIVGGLVTVAGVTFMIKMREMQEMQDNLWMKPPSMSGSSGLPAFPNLSPSAFQSNENSGMSMPSIQMPAAPQLPQLPGSSEPSGMSLPNFELPQMPQMFGAQEPSGLRLPSFQLPNMPGSQESSGMSLPHMQMPSMPQMPAMFGAQETTGLQMPSLPAPDFFPKSSDWELPAPPWKQREGYFPDVAAWKRPILPSWVPGQEPKSPMETMMDSLPWQQNR